MRYVSNSSPRSSYSPFFTVKVFSAPSRLMRINMILPPASVVFWIWGLVCAINGVQDVFAIVYYVAFVVMWLPFFISTIAAFFKRD